MPAIPHPSARLGDGTLQGICTREPHAVRSAAGEQVPRGFESACRPPDVSSGLPLIARVDCPADEPTCPLELLLKPLGDAVLAGKRWRCIVAQPAPNTVESGA